MKRVSFLVISFSILLLSVSAVYPEGLSGSKRESIVKNLVRGLNSGNSGLQVSAALRIFEFIGEMNVSKSDFSTAVIPLMKMLRDGNKTEEKVAAALALFKIEDTRGIYHLRYIAKSDHDDKVRRIGKNLYYQYHMANGTAYFIDF